jgi:hypothetical protein
MPTNAPDKIPPGLELDALTAQRVFGWKNFHKEIQSPGHPHVAAIETSLRKLFCDA